MDARKLVYNWRNIVHAFYPPTCCLCGGGGSAGRDLCANCAADLPALGAACVRCARPLPPGAGETCGACLQTPPACRRTLAPFRYAPPLDRLILDLKFNRRLHLARPLGELLADAAAAAERPDLILAVPLHPGRLAERGYNQALEIARFTARRLDLPLAWRECRRLRATPGQAGLSAAARQRNLRGAFACTDDLEGKRIAILDDVVTTGSTAGELARCLTGAGAGWVDLWALAKTPGPDR